MSTPCAERGCPLTSNDQCSYSGCPQRTTGARNARRTGDESANSLLNLAGASALALFFASPAFPDTSCDTRHGVETRLTQQYGETSIELIGTTNHGRASVYVWDNPETGSWTITIRTAGGQECIQLAGQNFAGGK